VFEDGEQVYATVRSATAEPPPWLVTGPLRPNGDMTDQRNALNAAVQLAREQGFISGQEGP
jgi:hypothetical protein